MIKLKSITDVMKYVESIKPVEMTHAQKVSYENFKERLIPRRRYPKRLYLED